MAAEDYLPYGCYEELDYWDITGGVLPNRRKKKVNNFNPNPFYYHTLIEAEKLDETKKAYRLKIDDFIFWVPKKLCVPYGGSQYMFMLWKNFITQGIRVSDFWARRPGSGAGR